MFIQKAIHSSFLEKPLTWDKYFIISPKLSLVHALSLLTLSLPGVTNK